MGFRGEMKMGRGEVVIFGETEETVFGAANDTEIRRKQDVIGELSVRIAN